MSEEHQTRKGRGSRYRPDPRYGVDQREAFDDGWQYCDREPTPLRTTVTNERPKTIINSNQSPDIPFEQSINPFRGCEHGCIYCYARPAHAYVDLSPGLDFESKLFAKPNAAELLRNELSKPGYRCKVISLGANTDAYQPIERRLEITRSILEVLLEFRHPVTIVSKSALVERDLDLLVALAELNLAHVFISVTTLDKALARRMEPRAAAPPRRLEVIRALRAAGVPVGTMFAPVIPALNDHELEQVLRAAGEAGAQSAGYVVLRLPREVNPLFKDWLEAHYPLRAAHVMSRVRQIRDGRESDVEFGRRLKGQGVFAKLLHKRFEKTCRELGFNQQRVSLSTAHFKAVDQQMSLF